MNVLRRWLLRLLLPSDFAAKVTTHEGFYSACDDEWHCVEVRRAIRREVNQ